MFQLTTTNTVSSYEDQFVKVRIVFQVLYFEKEVGETPHFFGISDIGNSLSDGSKSMKKFCVVEDFHTIILKSRFPKWNVYTVP